jgi:DNA invertase Pin-like site-specific DNA recombinase
VRVTGQRVAYQRVSSIAQSEDRQLEGVAVDRMYTDKVSGKDTNCPKLNELLDFVREGDTVVVHSMDRLARNLDDLRRLVRDLTRDGVKVEFVKENLTFSGEDSPMQLLLLSLLGSVAEFERALIKERQREGIAIAKKNGVYKGRKKALNQAQVIDLRDRAASGESTSELARQFGVHRDTVYSYFRDD